VGILSCLLELVKRGLVVKGHKAVHWDPVFRTALAEAEIEYHPHESPSIYVKFPLLEQSSPALLAAREKLAGLGVATLSIVIWTTTPWTLPANLGVTLHPSFDYVVLKHGSEGYIVAEGLAESFKAACKLEDAEPVLKFKAQDLELDRALCRHPIFTDKSSLVMLGEHVTLEQGTGCVHTAPGHGADDFIIGKKYGLPVFVPVDDQGRYTAEYPEMQGVFVFDANPKIVDLLKEKGLLLAVRTVKHDYPFSWRSKKPIIFRATEQWFMQLTEEGVRAQALDAIDHAVQWIPAWGRDRIRGMVERRPEWCISRQRSWGVPIPSIRSKQSGESILDPRIVQAFIDIVASRGTDAWFTEPLESFFPAGFVYEKTGEDKASDFDKEWDILDVWFDSGASHIACLEMDTRLRSPADLYLEGSDQHRGWFQAALLTSIGSRDRAPFKSVLTHGFILDGQGRAMSKSLGNVISPLDLIKDYGADILRLWVSSLDYSDDVSISKEIMDNTRARYRDIRKHPALPARQPLHFDPAIDAVPGEELLPLDVGRWARPRNSSSASPRPTSARVPQAYTAITQFMHRHAVGPLPRHPQGPPIHLRAEMGRTPLGANRHPPHVDILTRLLAPCSPFTCDEAHAYRESDSEFGSSFIQLADGRRPRPAWRSPRWWTTSPACCAKCARSSTTPRSPAARQGHRQVHRRGRDPARQRRADGCRAAIKRICRTSDRFGGRLEPANGDLQSRHGRPRRALSPQLRWVPQLVETSFGK
jgi:isoleucyl-tRNA synthetase